MLELEHVAFGDQPIAEIDPPDGEILTATVDQARPFGMNEIGGCGTRRPAIYSAGET
jgi:hypothetical protein